MFGSKLDPVKIKLNDRRILPFVESWPHLGFKLHKDESPDHDLLIKRGQFIGKLYSLRQQIGNVDPLVYTKLVSIYLTSFYGSPLWNLFSPAAIRLYSSWNIMNKINYEIPRESKRFLIEPIYETKHIKLQLIKRFINFYKALNQSDKPHVRFLAKIQANDLRSTFGKNIQNICKEADVNSLNMVDTSSLCYSPVPIDEEWKVSLIRECLEMRAGRLESCLTQKEITHIIDSVSN